MLRHLLRTPRRSAAAAAAAAALLTTSAAAAAASCFSSSHSRSTDVNLSVSPPLWDFISSKANLLLEDINLASIFPISPSESSFPLSLPLHHFLQNTGFPLHKSFVASPPPATALNNEASSENGDDSNGADCKCCKGCLGRNSIADAAAAAGPAVVNITVTQGVNGLVIQKSLGSGTIIDPDGTILTCAHVVVGSDNSIVAPKAKVSVTLQDGREFEGTVLNADLHSDVAVLKIKSKTPLPSARLGSSSQLRPGDWVVALGCPHSLQNTITAGIISCVDRKSSDLGLGGIRREYLQTDCAINQGNSGGPLVNLDGEIVGVNVMKVLQADGLNFAVPIDSVTKIMEHFKNKGRVVRPWLGLKMLDLNEMIISQLKERDSSFPNVTKGVLVPMVIPGSPADRAGFRPGDVVIEFDGKPIKSIEEIIDKMGYNAGVPFKVLVKRAGGKSVNLVVTPEEMDPTR